MSKPIRCKVITPEANVLDDEVTYASVPLWDGKKGFMHETGAFVGKLGIGELRLDLASGDSNRWFIDGGFVQMVANVLTILASGAIAASDIDPAEARAELAEANARRSEDTEEMDRITADRQRASPKLAMVGA